MQRFAGWLGTSTDANILDHNRVQLSSLENQLCTSVVNNSNSGQSLNLLVALERSQEACGDHTEITSARLLGEHMCMCTCVWG